MKPYYVLPHLGSSVQQAHTDRSKRPGRRIDGIPSFRTFRLVNDLESALRRNVDGFSRRRQRRRAIRELQGLSDHDLTDIGLDRSQIVSTVEAIIETRSAALAPRPLLTRRRHRPGRS